MRIKSLRNMTILVLFLSILGLFLLSFFTYNRNYTNGDFDSFSQDALNLLKNYTFDEDIIIPTDSLEKSGTDYMINQSDLEDYFDISVENENDEYVFSSNLGKVTLNSDMQTITSSSKTDISLVKAFVKSGQLYLPVKSITQSLGYIVQEEDNSLTFENPYSSMRLIVQSESKIDDINATEIVCGYKDYYILQYDTIQDALNSYNQLSQEGDIKVTFDTRVSASEIDQNQENIIKNSKNYAKNTIKTANYQNSSNILSSQNSLSSTQLSDNSYITWGASASAIDSYSSFLQQNIGTSNLREVIVAVLDTGLDSDHPWFTNRVASGGANYSTSQSTSTYPYEDAFGHGTHVAGTIVDLTYSNVKILPIKVLGDDGTGSSISIILGMQYVINLKSEGQNIYAMNMSLNGYSSDIYNPYEQVIQDAYNADILTIVSSGNDGANVENYTPSNVELALTVGAIGVDGNGFYRPYWSNYGDFVDIVAPGCSIESAYIGGGTMTMDGTSMAAPHVTGAIALMLSNPNQNIDFDEIVNKLTQGALDMGADGKDVYYGYGMLNIEYAYCDLVGSVNFSVSESEQDASFTLSLSSTLAGSVIYYTIDGSTPNLTNGIVYDGEITIDKSLQIKARAFYFASGAITKVSQIAQKTYVINGNDIENAYSVNEDGVLVSYNGVLTTVNVPSEINGIKIISIGSYAFSSTPVTEINLPDSVTLISDYAFTSLESLEYIYAPSVSRVGLYAFADCINLSAVNNSNFPSLVTIDSYAFFNCSGLGEDIILDNVTTIGDYAFDLDESQSKNLETISFENATKIGAYAFRGYQSKQLRLGNVQIIGSYAFAGNNSLSSLDLPNLKYLGANAFESNTSLSQVTLENIKTISSRAFYNCPLISVEISSAEIIGSNAFYNMSNLTQVDLQQAQIIGQSAFYGTGLISLNAPNLEQVNDYAFSRSNLKTIVLPSVVEIRDNGFSNNSTLEQVTLSSCVDIIDENAFVNISTNATFNVYSGIGENFAREHNFTINLLGQSTTFDYTIENSRVTITGVETSESTFEVPSYIENLPVYSIAQDAFKNCTSIQTLILPELEIIEENAFANCENLQTIRLENVKTISSHAFENCINLESVTIPNAEIIGDYAFNNCPKLKSISLENSVQHIGQYALGYENGNILQDFQIFGIPQSEAYRYAQENFITFNSLVQNLTSFYFEYYHNQVSGQVEISIALVDKALSGRIVLPESYNGLTISKIGDNAFEDCSLITEIILPSSFVNIGNDSFVSCTNLKAINLENITSIGERAFRNCFSLVEINLQSLTTLSSYAFQNCYSLEYVNAPLLTNISSYAFNNCTSLKSMNLPQVTTINNYAIEHSEIEMLYLPNIITLGQMSLRNVKNVVIGKQFTYDTRDYAVTRAPLSVRTNIYGYSSSTAQKYAQDYGNTFNAIDEFAITDDLDNSLNIGTNMDLTLTINASGFDLKYQWYKSNNNLYLGEAIANANSNSFRVDTSQNGIYYYYVTISNWDDSFVNSSICRIEIGSVYQISVTIQGNGSILTNYPLIDGWYYVGVNDDINLKFQALQGYHINSIILDGVILEDENLTDAIENGINIENIAENHSIYVEFVKNSYTITLIQTEGGTISRDKDIYYYGDSAVITITPNDNYFVKSILVNNREYSQLDLEKYTIESVDKNYTISAIFEYIENVSFTVNYYIQNLNADDYTLYDSETKITNYTFDHMTNAEAIEITGFTPQDFAQKELAIDGSTVIDIFYTRNSYTLTLHTSEGTENLIGSGNYQYYSPIIISADITYGYSWQCWTDADGNVFNLSQECSFFMPANDLTLIATAIKASFTINASSSQNGTISNDGEKIVQRGDNITYYITANEGYTVTQILIDGKLITGSEFEEILENGYYTFENITEDHDIQVLFAKLTYAITVTQNANGQIEYYSDIYEYGQNGTFVIKANTGYIIKYLIIDGQKIDVNKQETQYTFKNITQNHSISAEYQLDNTQNNGGFQILIWVCVAFVGLSILSVCAYLYRKRIYNKY